MKYFTMTDLRTRSSALVETLKRGEKVSLIHRSKVIGVVEPQKPEFRVITDVEALKKALRALRPQHIIPREKREEVYRRSLEEKYGPFS